MKYFLDSEFAERGPQFPIELISIAIVAEDGREFYAVSNEFDPATCNDWVKTNVLPLLPPKTSPLWMSRAEIRRGVEMFIDEGDTIEIYGFYPAYDSVVFAQLFGTMADLPSSYPMNIIDLNFLLERHGLSRLESPEGAHDALIDAQWAFRLYQYIKTHINDLYPYGI